MKTSFPKGKIKIVLLEGVHEDGVRTLEDAGFAVEALPDSPDPKALAPMLAGARVLGIRSKTQLTRELLHAAPKLMTVGAFCIGTNQIDLPAATAMGVPVFNAPFANTRSVAELTIAEVVALHRRLFERSAAAHEGRWLKSASGSHEVRGRTLGLVGYGHIGSQVSVMAEAMGLRVVFFDTAAKLALGNAEAMHSLNDLLRVSDVVSLHVPANDSTKGLFGARQFEAMRPGALLINNARGSVVDIAALAASLKSGHLGGAALDVFPEEPASPEQRFTSEVQGLGNVILTPHIGGSTEEAQRAISLEVAHKLVRFIDQGTTTGSVNAPEVDLPEQASVETGDTGGAGGRPHRVLNFHRNEPGFLGALNDAVAKAGANVSGQYLRTRGELGYVVLDVDPTDAGDLREIINRVPGSIRTRVLW
ncbi:MAG: D-3-phosphoglycerate dehydrogenase [Phycisphaerales bacterium]|jgi:D-3-phosphoglycerate dehydrogenase